MDYKAFAFYTYNGIGVSGLTVTCDIFSSQQLVLSDASVDEIGSGFYSCLYSATVDDDYLFLFKTTSSTVDQNQVGALYSSRITTPQDVWNYYSRTLTQTVTTGGNQPVMTRPIIFYTNSTNTVSVDNVSDEPEIWFTMKSEAMLPDEDSTIQISKTEGLIYANGNSASMIGLDSSDGNVSVSSGTASVYVSSRAAPLLFGNLPNNFLGEIKTKTSASIVTIVTQFPIEVRVALTRKI